jgi:hypothetical protein
MKLVEFLLNVVIPWAFIITGLTLGWNAEFASNLEINSTLMIMFGFMLLMMADISKLRREVQLGAIERAAVIIRQVADSIEDIPDETEKPSGEVPDADKAEGAEQQGQEGKG